MTDKQIIIDGVDVRGCKHYHSNGMCDNAFVYDEYCKDFHKCIYKLANKLQAKEQECERLASTLTEIKEIAKYELNNLTESAINGGRYVEILQKISEVIDE